MKSSSLQPSKSRIEKRHEYFSRSRNKSLWRVPERFFNKEMKPVLEYVSDERLQDSIRMSLRKYLIISCVSLIEDFLSILIIKVIDQNNMPIASLIGGSDEPEAKNKVMRLEKKIGKTVTKGQYVALKHRLTIPQEIDELFTSLLYLDDKSRKLNMRFFEAAKRIDWYSPYIYVKGRIPLSKNWKRFIEMFELRNEIVHNLKDVELSHLILSSNCDNTINLLEAAVFIADPTFREDVISQFQSNRRIR